MWWPPALSCPDVSAEDAVCSKWCSDDFIEFSEPHSLDINWNSEQQEHVHEQKKMHFCLCVEPPTFYSCLLLHRNVCYVTYTTRWWRNRGIDKYNNWLASLKTQHSIIKQVEILHNLIWVRKKWLSTFLPSGICWVLWGTVKPAFSWLVVHLKQSDWQKGNGFIYVFFSIGLKCNLSHI